MGLFKRTRAEVHEAMEAIGQLQEVVRSASQMQEMAKQAQSIAAGQVGNLGDLMAYRDRVMRLTQHGQDGTATVRAVRQLGTAPGGVGIEMEFDLTVTAGPGAPRDVTARQAMLPGADAPIKPGDQVGLKIDPQDPDQVLVWGNSSLAQPGVTPTMPVAPPVASAEEDRIGRLERLAQLRTSGAITEEEFHQQKARILGSG